MYCCPLSLLGLLPFLKWLLTITFLSIWESSGSLGIGRTSLFWQSIFFLIYMYSLYTWIVSCISEKGFGLLRIYRTSYQLSYHCLFFFLLVTDVIVYWCLMPLTRLLMIWNCHILYRVAVNKLVVSIPDFRQSFIFGSFFVLQTQKDVKQNIQKTLNNTHITAK